MVDEDHLPAPLHLRMGPLLLTLRLPRLPRRRLLLRDADQHDPPVATLRGSGVDQRTGVVLLVLTLREVHHRDGVLLGVALHVLDPPVPDRLERRR